MLPDPSHLVLQPDLDVDLEPDLILTLAFPLSGGQPDMFSLILET
jgi:hypothetical protein